MLTKYYDILGISHEANIEEIKQAYRVKAKQYHPDINDSLDAHEKFIEIQEAYQHILTYKALASYKEAQKEKAKQAYKNYRQQKQEENYDYDLYREWLINEMRKRQEQVRNRQSPHQKTKIDKNLHSIGNYICIGMGLLTFVGSIGGLVTGGENGVFTGVLTMIISLIMMVYAIIDLEKGKRQL